VNAENITHNVQAEQRRAAESLQAAEALASLRLYNDAISRAYYVALYTVRALLVSRGLEAKSHHGVHQLFHLHWVRTGEFDSAIAADLANLATYRELSDYNSTVIFSEQQASDDITRARRFMEYGNRLLDQKPPSPC
jgi:uncharacterized protein (UPF0332 family)